jgi:hypothetical protein
MSDELTELVETLAAETDDISSIPTPTGADYLRNRRAFAAVDGAAVELRLLSDISEAARRTPDTSASARGEDWVRFAPATWDEHATDRLEAWFRVAWRFAGDR